MKFQLLTLLLILFSCDKTDQINPLSKKAVNSLINKKFNNVKSNFEKACSFNDKSACLVINNDYENAPHKVAINMSAPLENNIIFNGVTKLSGHLYFVIKNDRNNFILPNETNEVSDKNNDFKLVTATFKNLPGKDYYLLVFDENNKLVDKRLFTNDNPLEKENSKIAIVSCLSDYYKEEQKVIWSQLSSDKPDVVLFIGDNVYIDTGIYRKLPVTPYQIWKRWFETRTTVHYSYLPKLIPTMAIWDDHDYGKNNGGAGYANADSALDAIHAFMPNPLAESYKRGPGAGYTIKSKNLDIIFLDNRSFRQVDDEDGDHLGQKQLKVLKRFLTQNKKKKLVIKGDQFFGGYHRFESYQGNHPVEFGQFLQIVYPFKDDVFLISGDRHISETMNVDGLREITSSPVHSKVFPDSFNDEKNPYRLFGMGDKFNYVLMDFDWASSLVNVIVRDIDNQTRYKKAHSL